MWARTGTLSMSQGEGGGSTIALTGRESAGEVNMAVVGRLTPRGVAPLPPVVEERTRTGAEATSSFVKASEVTAHLEQSLDA
jgi:hypothetical protein